MKADHARNNVVLLAVFNIKCSKSATMQLFCYMHLPLDILSSKLPSSLFQF